MHHISDLQKCGVFYFVYLFGCLPIRENVKPICSHIGEKCKAVDKGINANVTVMLQNVQNT